MNLKADQDLIREVLSTLRGLDTCNLKGCCNRVQYFIGRAATPGWGIMLNRVINGWASSNTGDGSENINLEEWSFSKIREHENHSVCWSETISVLFFGFHQMNWDAAFLLAGIILIKMVSGTGTGSDQLFDWFIFNQSETLFWPPWKQWVYLDPCCPLWPIIVM